MDIVYRRGSATAAEIHEEMEDAPTYTTVRGLLRILAAKGRLAIAKEGARYVYRPTVAKDMAGETTLAHVVQTFFGGSASQAVSALLGAPSVELGKDEIERLQRLLDDYEAREKEG